MTCWTRDEANEVQSASSVASTLAFTQISGQAMNEKALSALSLWQNSKSGVPQTLIFQIRETLYQIAQRFYTTRLIFY